MKRSVDLVHLPVERTKKKKIKKLSNEMKWLFSRTFYINVHKIPKSYTNGPNPIETSTHKTLSNLYVIVVNTLLLSFQSNFFFVFHFFLHFWGKWFRGKSEAKLMFGVEINLYGFHFEPEPFFELWQSEEILLYRLLFTKMDLFLIILALSSIFFHQRNKKFKEFIVYEAFNFK